MSEINAGAQPQAEHDNLFRDSTDPTKSIRYVKDPYAAALLQTLIDSLSGSGAVWSKFEVTIPASSTVVVDTNLILSFSRLDYILNFKNSPITVTKSLKLVAQNNAGVVTDSISERLGGAINLAVNLTDDSVDAFLEITNNEAYPLTLTYLRSKI